MATISSFSPNPGTYGATITILGSGFTGTTNVLFGNVTAHLTTVISDTEIQCVIHESLSGNIVVVNPAGNATISGFIYAAAPSIEDFSPGAAAPGQKIVITGSGFTGATGVQFGDTDALFFNIVSDSEIDAYTNISGNGTITVTGPAGSSSLPGFTLLIVKVQITDLPSLNRPATDDDLMYVFDFVKKILCQSPISNLPSTGGGGGGTGNSNIVLGSPFKVRTSDEGTYQYDEGSNTVSITDIRLIGQGDVVVYATDLNAEIENFVAPASAATSSGTTTAANDTYSAQPVTSIASNGLGAILTVVIVGGVPTSISFDDGGKGYFVGDTFTIDSLPGLTFTVSAIGAGTGQLIFDPINGILTILNYQLQDDRHLTITTSGVPNDQFTSYVNSLKSTIITTKKLLAAFAPGGVAVVFRKAASLIPAGWQECTDLRGRIPIMIDPTDIFNADTNPEALGQIIGTPLGGKTVTLLQANIPNYNFTINGALKYLHGTAQNGGNDTNGLSRNDDGRGQFVINSGGSGTAFSKLPPVKIVEYIEFIG